MAQKLGNDVTCSVARTLDVVGDRWTLMIVREAMLGGATRFQDFRDALGIATNSLAKRLAMMVDEGLMERRTYREAGERPREEYVLTEAGRSLDLVIGALASWGRTYRPHPRGTSPRFEVEESSTVAQVAFVTSGGDRIPPGVLTAVRTEDRRLDDSA
ncbi:winged helix-turn-helix transcriptional regulator [Kribbella sp. CA-253562]|uniref:winged helix-turn-helix transcriptional regulator n=1 Tax=Kribbella sp. CA-253562 TaxID=3239942 RepID=UPI003D8FC46E